MMRDCLVLGSGRSGTSMVAGSIGRAGYFQGDALMPPTVSNPKGYFESFEIEALNERLLAPLVPARPRGPLGLLYPTRLRRAQRWLAEIEPGAVVAAAAREQRRMAALTARRPFCFKDPRFCYTLPAWRQHLGDALFVVVFRHPSVTAHSIETECRTADYLRNVRMDFDRAIAVWQCMYRHVVERHRHAGDWLFVHFDQVLDGSGLARIAARSGAPIDATFPDTALERSRALRPAPPAALELYAQLCELAGRDAGP